MKSPEMLDGLKPRLDIDNPQHGWYLEYLLTLRLASSDNVKLKNTKNLPGVKWNFKTIFRGN